MIKRLVCIIGALVGSLTLSQAPEYTQQYNQRLAGAVDELAAVVAGFDADAARFGLTRDEALSRFGESPDDFLAQRGMSMQAVIARYERLRAQLDTLRQANVTERLMSLSLYFDTDVGRAALEDYEPAIPVTIEGLLLAVAGWVAGYALLWGGATAVTMPFRKRRSKVNVSRAS